MKNPDYAITTPNASAQIYGARSIVARIFAMLHHQVARSATNFTMQRLVKRLDNYFSTLDDELKINPLCFSKNPTLITRFNFNDTCHLRLNYLNAYISPAYNFKTQTASVKLPDLVPADFLTYPSEATHVAFIPTFFLLPDFHYDPASCAYEPRTSEPATAYGPPIPNMAMTIESNLYPIYEQIPANSEISFHLPITPEEARENTLFLGISVQYFTALDEEIYGLGNPNFAILCKVPIRLRRKFSPNHASRRPT